MTGLIVVIGMIFFIMGFPVACLWDDRRKFISNNKDITLKEFYRAIAAYGGLYYKIYMGFLPIMLSFYTLLFLSLILGTSIGHILIIGIISIVLLCTVGLWVFKGIMKLLDVSENLSEIIEKVTSKEEKEEKEKKDIESAK